MNRCILMGRLTADPETRYAKTKDGEMAVCRFRMAVNRRFKRPNESEADFLNCVSFGKTAENIQKYFSKGDQILVESHVQTGSYEKDGQKRYTTDFIIDAFDFTQKKSEEKKTEEEHPDPGEFVPVPDDEVGLPW